MRLAYAAFTLLLLIPGPAFACATTVYVPEYVAWWSVPLFAVAGFLLRMFFEVRDSLLPVAVAIASIMVALLGGTVYRNDPSMEEIIPLGMVLFLFIPLAAIYRIRSKVWLAVALTCVFSVGYTVASTERAVLDWGGYVVPRDTFDP